MKQSRVCWAHAAFAQGDPREIENGQIDGAGVRKTGKGGVSRFAVSGDQDTEDTVGERNTIVGHILTARSCVRKPKKTQSRFADGETDFCSGGGSDVCICAQRKGEMAEKPGICWSCRASIQMA